MADRGPVRHAILDPSSLELDLTFLRNTVQTMSTGERHLYGRNREAQRAALAAEWRRLARAATFVAVLTSPAIFALLYVGNDWPLGWALLGTILSIAAFRGLIDVVAHRCIPRPSLYGAGRELLEEDIVARRRLWYWREKYRRLTYLARGSASSLLIRLADQRRRRSATSCTSIGDCFSNPQTSPRC